MRKSCLAVLVVGLFIGAAGCAAPSLTQSAEDHMHSVKGVSDWDSQALMDDIDLWFQLDRRSRLSRWHDR